MIYNIWFEVCTISFLIIIWIFYHITFKNKTRQNIFFERMLIWVFLMNVTDILSAITISYHTLVPIWVNYITNGSNFLSIGISGYYFVCYVITLVHGPETKVPKYNFRILNTYMVLELVNPFFGYFWSFSEPEGYIHGKLYLFQLLFSYYWVLYTAFVLIYNMKTIDRRRFVATASYVVIMILVGFVQVFVLPTTLMTGFSSTLTLLIIYLSMETPDYIKLMETMKELEEAKVSANAANDAKSKFLANMSHEIRTPLNTVLGMDEMILREEKDPEILEYARNIKSSGSNLLGIINDILDFSKIESGMMTITEYDYDISSSISNVYTMLFQKAKDKGLDLIVKVDENIPKVLFGDEMRISQMIINLVNNAIKYTENGTVTLDISTEIKDQKEALLLIKVKDTGIGIKPEDKEKLFKEFERLDLKRNRTVEGTGLGLAITGRLAHQMKGKISVDSVYEVGSVFSVELPQMIVDATPIGTFTVKASVSEDENYHESFVAPKAKILAVDDNAVNLEVLKKLLKATKVQISTATSGRKALKLIEKEAFDIVLMDHMMPEMDGIQTLHKAKDLEGILNRHAVYIALTANAIQGADKQYKAVGFDDYVTKPVNSKELERKLKSFIPKDLIES